MIQHNLEVCCVKNEPISFNLEDTNMQCEHEDVTTDDGERICTCCGVVLGAYIDEGAEWRIYANTEDDPSRTGTMTSELLPNSSYGSMMMRKRMPNQSEEAKNIAKLSAWAYSSHGERAWMGIFDAIQSTATRACLPRAIISDACGFFRNLPDSQKTRGETRRALMAACVIIACRRNDATRSPDEIAKLFHVSIRSLNKALDNFENESSGVLETQLGLAERMCAELELNDTERDKVMTMLQNLPELEHTPKTIVAGVLSIVVGNQNQKISEVSGVSSVSIRKITDKLKKLGNM
jgi:transcription initiation factor TFIIIB Brf1 subunit/transcription initiation factor TFIIB